MPIPVQKNEIKVLLPFDFSLHSRATLDFALSLERFAEISFLLIHVVATGEVETFANLGAEPGEEIDRRVGEAEARLAVEIEQFRRREPHLRFEAKVASGVPFKEICRMAEQEGVDLIVIGTHGRTGLSHMLIGSTAERVVQHASCPVLSLRPEVSGKKDGG